MSTCNVHTNMELQFAVKTIIVLFVYVSRKSLHCYIYLLYCYALVCKRFEYGTNKCLNKCFSVLCMSEEETNSFIFVSG